MGLKQYIKRKTAQKKAASLVKQKAEKEERQRLQHLMMQRKLEEKKTRLMAAKVSGIKAAQPKTKKLKETLSPLAKRAYEIGKTKGLKFLQDVFKEEKKRRKHRKRTTHRKRRR